MYETRRNYEESIARLRQVRVRGAEEAPPLPARMPQAERIDLSADQIAEIDWQDADGPEPSGG